MHLLILRQRQKPMCLLTQRHLLRLKDLLMYSMTLKDLLKHLCFQRHLRMPM